MKHNGPTLSSHLGFNVHHDKSEKIFGGIINVILLTIFFAPIAYFNWVDWSDDTKPYIKSITYPFATDAEYYDRGK